MAQDINFLSTRRKQVTKQQTADKRLFRISLVVLAVGIVAMALVVGYRLYLSFQIGQVGSASEVLRQRILSNESTEKTYVVLVNKLSLLSDIFAERSNKQKAISFFTKLFGPQVLIQQIEFDDSGQILSMQFRSRDVFTMERILEQLDGDEVRGQYPEIGKSNLQRTDDGSYMVSLAVTVSEKKKVVEEAPSEESATEEAPAATEETAP